MLALNHRISDDVDLFINSPGWIPYVSPRLNDEFEDKIIGYQEEADHVKLRFPAGEIDFIVRNALLSIWVESDDLWNPPAQEMRSRCQAILVSLPNGMTSERRCRPCSPAAHEEEHQEGDEP